ncbi:MULTISPECIES: GAF and ANTAR domain-containing protein [Streptomyces]|uniref:GAF and ANTAR domain-containing protein n=1 Tax=Streptomyces TaxID=1883 RepID=UPI00292CD41D|nr:GAF and ANTAR domain-containing protein [Streptomyces sp. NEAU-HV9]
MLKEAVEVQRVDEAIVERLRGVAPRAVPGRVCALAVELLPVTGASVSLCVGGLPVRIGASDEVAADMAELQATLGDGPCLYAAGIAAPVLARDLTALPALLRWPVFSHQATAAGVRAVTSIPLGIEPVCVGTLDLYGAEPGDVDGGDLHTALVLAGVLTAALLALPRADEDTEPSGRGGLSGLTGEHDQIHRAVGMIMAQLRVPADEALDRLRGYAFARGRTVLDVAHDLVGHRGSLDVE